MRRRAFIGFALGVACVRAVAAQAAKEPRRIAHLTALSAEVSKPWLAAFREGMRQHGYVEGRDYVMETRFAAAQYERMPSLAAELAGLQPDLFLAYGAEAVQAAAAAAPRLPIVFANIQDPIASGLVSSLARPGGNITGMSDYHAASSTKRLELLKEALPALSRIAVFWRASHAAHPQQVKELQAAGPIVGVSIVPMHVTSAEEIERAFATMKSERVGAVLMLGDAFLSTHMRRIIDLGVKNRIVAMYTTRQFAQVGGMMAYGTDIADLFRRSATHVDRIFKGVKPGDLPIEQPVKFDLVLNLKTARALGVTIPRSLLLRADHVIR